MSYGSYSNYILTMNIYVAMSWQQPRDCMHCLIPLYKRCWEFFHEVKVAGT
jgi:hypothetical protein